MDRLAEAAAHARTSHELGRHAHNPERHHHDTQHKRTNIVPQHPDPQLDTARTGRPARSEAHEVPLSNTSSPTLVNGDNIRQYVDKEGREDLPRLRGFHLWHRKWSNFGYAAFILMCNLALPCLLYYLLRDNTDLSERALIGIGSATLGISSSCDGPFRLWKLWKHRDLYGPLNDPVKWHLDWTMHLYSYSLFPIFALPLCIASLMHPPMHDFFIMSTPMLVACPGIFFLISLFGFKTPFWMSSDPPGTVMKPGVFYLFEDIGAVDFRHGKEFRRVLHERYAASPVYRDMMWYETLWWAVGSAVFFASGAAVTWTTTFGFAYGFILGLLFIWVLIWTVASVFIAQYFHHLENEWLEVQRSDPEKARRLTRHKTLERRYSSHVKRGEEADEARRAVRAGLERTEMQERPTATEDEAQAAGSASGLMHPSAVTVDLSPAAQHSAEPESGSTKPKPGNQ